MSATLEQKRERLDNELKALENVAIAFSGGVDSAFLVAEAARVLGDRVLAITVRSVAFPRSETEEAQKFCHQFHIRQQEVDFDVLAVDGFATNPPDRCYHCKRALLELIVAKAHQEGFVHVLEGSNADDLNDYRPGLKAVKEWRLLSPLAEANLTKAEIRELSTSLGLPTASKPSAACLASRIPFNSFIDAETLKRIEAAEGLLRDQGFTQLRVRVQGDGARIEIPEDEFDRFWNPAFRQTVVSALRTLGFSSVSLDLEGYRSGSLNPVKHSSIPTKTEQ